MTTTTTFDPKKYAGAVAAGVGGFFLGGPLGAVIGAVAGYYGQAAIEARLTPHWVLSKTGQVQPGDYFAIALTIPTTFTDFQTQTVKDALTAKGYDQTKVSPANPLAPTPPAGTIALQGRYTPTTPGNACLDAQNAFTMANAGAPASPTPFVPTCAVLTIVPRVTT